MLDIDATNAKLWKWNSLPFPDVIIKVTIDGDFIILNDHAFEKLEKLCEKHNVKFREDNFSKSADDAVKNFDFLRHEYNVTISDGEMTVTEDRYYLKNIILIKKMIFTSLEHLVDFSDILSPKSFKEALMIKASLVSRLKAIQDSLGFTITLIREFKGGSGWREVIDNITDIKDHNIPSILAHLDSPILDKKISSLIVDINNMFTIDEL